MPMWKDSLNNKFTSVTFLRAAERHSHIDSSKSQRSVPQVSKLWMRCGFE